MLIILILVHVFILFFLQISFKKHTNQGKLDEENQKLEDFNSRFLNSSVSQIKTCNIYVNSIMYFQHIIFHNFFIFHWISHNFPNARINII